MVGRVSEAVRRGPPGPSEKVFPTDNRSGYMIRMTEPVSPFPDNLAPLLDDLPMEELAFTPIPVKARHDGWTPDRQRGFIQRLAIGGCVAVAAKGVGKSRESAYRLRERAGAEGFAAAWDKAIGWGRERTTDLGLERALIGEVRSVFYRGRKVGERVQYDNRLMIAVLNNFRRDAEPDGEEAATRFHRAVAALNHGNSLD